MIFETLVAWCWDCMGYAKGRGAIDAILHHSHNTKHNICMDYGPVAKKLPKTATLLPGARDSEFFRTVHAHCLKCSNSEHGFGAVDRIIDHAEQTGHRWTFDYRRV